MSSDSEISNRLRLARKNAGYRSARAFALAHKIPYVTYSQHEAGNRRLNPNVLLKYSQILNISPAWLLMGTEETSNKNENFIELNTSGTFSVPINENFFADIFIEINNLLYDLKIKINDKDKINLASTLYNILVIGNENILIKKENLTKLLDTIRNLQIKKETEVKKEKIYAT